MKKIPLASYGTLPARGYVTYSNTVATNDQGQFRRNQETQPMLPSMVTQFRELFFTHYVSQLAQRRSW